MARNYYGILGVDPDASLDQIRSAYRRKAKQLHPDHYPGSSEPFRAVQEAYEALCDPARRECYDAELERERRARAVPWHAPAPPRSNPCPVEPLIPNAPSFGGEQTPYGPSRYAPFAERLERLWDEWDSTMEPIDQEYGADQVVISLTRAQAQRGGRARLWIAVPSRCPRCLGMGRLGFYACSHCYGQGTVVDQRPVWIAFPAGVDDRSVARVSLEPLGVPDAYLAVRFSVR